MFCSGTSRPPKRGADTEVDPAPEGQGAAGVVSLGFVVVGVWEDARVADGSGQPKKDFAPAGRSTPPGVTGAFVTRRQTELDGSRRRISSR